MSGSYFLVTFLLAYLVVGSYAYLYIVPGEIGKSADHEGYCYYGDKKILIKVGESVSKDCEEFTCHEDYSIRIAGCGTFSINDPSCKRFQRDYSKPYPVCCTSFYCAEPAEKHDESQSKIDKNIL